MSKAEKSLHCDDGWSEVRYRCSTRVGNQRLRLGSVANPCKKVESGGVPNVTPLMIKLGVCLRVYDPPAP
ncbi:hypothetical protein GW17_00046135 [Ensete ventricosum]|nr:hypothetical protein GW17_00046135 [Ensete ventricosum]